MTDEQVILLIREAEKNYRERLRNVVVAMLLEPESAWEGVALREMLAVLDKLDGKKA